MKLSRKTYVLLLCIWGCSKNQSVEDILQGRISYPFVETKPLGLNPEEEKFIVRSIVDHKTLEFEIPLEEDTDIEVPLGEMDPMYGRSGNDFSSDVPKKSLNPTTTDQEMVKEIPNVLNRGRDKSALMNQMFGTTAVDKEGPSYVMGIAKVNDYYKKKQFEYALVELNNLLVFYPNSPKLHKMKGTILLKMQNYTLAERTWIKALELEPEDKVLRQAISKLQNFISKVRGNGQESIPRPVSQIP